MKPKRIWANFGVEDIERTQRFYQTLGFKVNGSPTKDLVSFFFSDNEFIIHFFQKKHLKSSLEGEVADLSKGNEIIFTLQTENKDEFDHWIIEVKKAGGTILFDSNKDRKPLYDENGFFVCVFVDPDGHKFNIFYNNNM